ncbi:MULTISPECIES: fimbrial protein [Pseudomonas aeruginosa group]|uniref:Fimbrial family protein n=2 Tax=Pseudomonas paraeruginosa TaxID=2994495 RepID=A0A2R3IZR1_9PSED|nr:MULTISPECIES: fimbrial protein [Pseudomonas aeruginosa group]VTS64937.1 fimbrial protein BcfF [Streptococcus dysgalactiae subsp. equisimilis]AVK07401.1 fimbrial family protein [Pseudomonas paraeruginosa]AVR69127.1 type 1 fimbrial protein [Pseudomonas paraeruginosa]AWE93440.1 fimbrial family protein [Pseudomonas paraeruginosa]KSD68786.2 fimbrial protein [Pseudomonas aeruginosa]
MSISMKSLLAAAVASLVVGNAMAADGTINFTGNITAASCNITGGAGTGVTGDKGNKIIDVNLGTVSIDALGGTAGGGIAAGTNINLDLDCGATGTGLTHVQLRFDPQSGSQIDPNNNQLLKLTGGSTAKGVGIGLYKQDGTRINLSNSSDVFEEALVKAGTDPNYTYSAKLNLRAGYVMTASDAKGVTAGSANGTLPFTLTYR